MPAFLAQLLLIRLKQGFRALRSVGWLLLIAIPMGGILLLVGWDKLAGLPAWAFCLVISGLFLFMHWQRRDLEFLRKCVRAVPPVLFIEYQCLLLPITVPVIWLGGSWEAALLTHLAVGLIALLPGAKSPGVRRAIRLPWIPDHNLEWKGGIRRQWRVLLPVYLAGILLSVYIPGTLLSITFVLMTVLGFYDELENRMLLESSLERGFLRKKWWAHYRLFVLLMLPQILLFLVFHPEYWYFMAFLLLVAGVFIGCALFYKYSTYLPNRRRANNQTPMSIMFMSLIIPFLAPLSLIAFFVLHQRARKRLQYFFPHAQH
jgi:hypothetical protein